MPPNMQDKQLKMPKKLQMLLKGWNGINSLILTMTKLLYHKYIAFSHHICYISASESVSGADLMSAHWQQCSRFGEMGVADVESGSCMDARPSLLRTDPSLRMSAIMLFVCVPRVCFFVVLFLGQYLWFYISG